jgi:hypothetical protein
MHEKEGGSIFQPTIKDENKSVWIYNLSISIVVIKYIKEES